MLLFDSSILFIYNLYHSLHTNSATADQLKTKCLHIFCEYEFLLVWSGLDISITFLTSDCICIKSTISNSFKHYAIRPSDLTHLVTLQKTNTLCTLQRNYAQSLVNVGALCWFPSSIHVQAKKLFYYFLAPVWVFFTKWSLTTFTKLWVKFPSKVQLHLPFVNNPILYVKCRCLDKTSCLMKGK